MNYDEFAFANQQLAGMLKHELPLEDALRQLSESLERGQWREEFRQLEADLAKGTPLKTALEPRRLPEFYKRMLQIGVQSGDLPGLLTLVADYYQKLNSIWIRLQGLLVYPLIVLLTALVLSMVLAYILTSVGQSMASPASDFLSVQFFPPGATAGLFLPPVVLALLLVAAPAVLVIPSWRRSLQWRFPAFREAAIARFASAMALMIRKGCPLSETVSLMASLEIGTPLGRELAEWRAKLASGLGKFSEFAGTGGLLPPLFRWLVSNAGEDLAGGFDRAAEIYQGRALHRVEMMLYTALPVSVLLLGFMIIGQIWPALQGMIRFMDMLGSFGE